MKFTHDLTQKPYYRCLSRPRFRSMCGGIPTRGMDLKEWSEYIRDVMDCFHLTSEYVAEKSEVSKRKIDSIHAINVDQDIMRATARRVEQVVLGSVTSFICDMDYDSKSAAEKIIFLESEVAYWRKENDRKAMIIDTILTK